MPRSTEKTILFCRVEQGKRVHSYPVAVFAGEASAKKYAVMLFQAHRAGDKDTAIALDPHVKLTDDGALCTGARFSIAKVQYEPDGLTEDVSFLETTPATT